FRHRGVDVHRVHYADIVNKGRTTVRRRWRWLTLPEVREKVFRGAKRGEALYGDPRQFDLNGDGSLDLEEWWTSRAAQEAVERGVDIKEGRKPVEEELEFRTVEREVVLDLP